MYRIAVALCVIVQALAFRISEHPDPECKHVGMFKANPDNECTYLRCDYGDEPWKDNNGNVALFTVRMQCPVGTSVDKYNFNKEEPCNIVSNRCPVGCQRIGEFIPSENPCYYKVCTYGDEPWEDAFGKVALFGQEHRCPNSLGSNINNFNKNNPCDTPNDSCKYTPKHETKYVAKIEKVAEPEVEEEESKPERQYRAFYPPQPLRRKYYGQDTHKREQY